MEHEYTKRKKAKPTHNTDTLEQQVPHDRFSPGKLFIANFCSNPGLIYGINERRVGYFLNQTEYDNNTIDQYNFDLTKSIIFGNHDERERNTGINNEFFYLLDKKELSMEKEREIMTKLKVPQNIKDVVKNERPHPAWDVYFRPGGEGGASKFNVNDIYQEVSEQYGGSIYHKLHPSKDKTYITPMLLFKRGSKLGIEMAARGEAVIHFALDGVNMEDVVHKTGENGSSITSSELRYAFRNMDRLKGRLFFYQDRKQVEAPWESNAVLWSAYHPRTQNRNIVPSGAAVTIGMDRSIRKKNKCNII